MKSPILATAVLFALTSLFACGAEGDDDDDSSETISDLATDVEGTYVGDGVINLRPEVNYTMTVTRSGSNQVDLTGDGFSLTVTLRDVDGMYTYASTEGAVSFDTTLDPMELTMAMSSADAFYGVKQ